MSPERKQEESLDPSKEFIDTLKRYCKTETLKPEIGLIKFLPLIDERQEIFRCDKYAVQAVVKIKNEDGFYLLTRELKPEEFIKENEPANPYIHDKATILKFVPGNKVGRVCDIQDNDKKPCYLGKEEQYNDYEVIDMRVIDRPEIRIFPDDPNSVIFLRNGYRKESIEVFYRDMPKRDSSTPLSRNETKASPNNK